MKENKILQNKANPTIRIQERIINVIRKSEKPISLTKISELSKTGFNETKNSINFLHKLGFIDIIVSTGNITFVILKKTGELQNARN